MNLERESSSSERELDTTDLPEVRSINREICPKSFSSKDLAPSVSDNRGEIENEYEYLKLSRSESGNNSVAGRLAQSSNKPPETPPKNFISHRTNASESRHLSFKELSVSPDVTEYDNIEADTEAFDDGTGVLAPTLPSVEDGLSSGHISDCEESPQHVPAEQVLASNQQESLDMQVREFFKRTESSECVNSNEQTKVQDRKKALDDAIKV